MDTLPIELVTIIAVDTFELFVTLLRVNTIGQRLCAEYPQLVAKKKFINTFIDTFGTRTYLNNKLHSFNDQPAVMFNSHGKKWYRHGKLHRRNLPAVIYPSSEYWYWNGLRHRDNDLPAFECTFGTKEWYVHGEFIKRTN